MGYYVSSMIGINTDGIFSENFDIGDVTATIKRIAKEYADSGGVIDIDLDDPSHCISRELEAHKGSYVVIAGVFNYWGYEYVSEFASLLSKEFRTEVMVMTWNMERDEVNCNIYLDGEELFEVVENPIGRTLRRIK